MSTEHIIDIPAHRNIYCHKTRSLKLCFNEPSSGINDDTGLLLFIPGFGGNLNSKVYKKMRNKFADQYNLVTIQCDYFGIEFMQVPDFNNIKAEINVKRFLQELYNKNSNLTIDSRKLDVDTVRSLASKYHTNIWLDYKFNETIENFNDMGLMQALDNLTALLAVIAILKDNNLIFNTKKIIASGFSHGAYLSFLCNAFAPTLFSLLIDNSAWLLPLYLNPNIPRCLPISQDDYKIYTCINYLAAQLPYDKELLELPSLYKKFSNNCLINSFHGTTDDLVPCHDKKKYCSSIPLSNYNEISATEVDGRIFRSTNHGLDADFLELFHYNMTCYNDHFNKSSEIVLPDVSFNTSKYIYELNYSTGFPNLTKKQTAKFN